VGMSGPWNPKNIYEMNEDELRRDFEKTIKKRESEKNMNKDIKILYEMKLIETLLEIIDRVILGDIVAKWNGFSFDVIRKSEYEEKIKERFNLFKKLEEYKKICRL